VLDTGLRQYRVHTQNGVETSREESGAYRALVFGHRFLVVRTAGGESQVAEGKLAPWPSELESQLFDSKEMRSLRANFYPFYLDGDSFRRPGYVVIAVGIVFLLLFLWQAVPAFRAWRNPDGHPLALRIAKWGGDPMGVAVEAEREFDNPMLKGKAGWRLGNKYLVRSSFFTFNVLRFQDVLWAYKKVTKHSVNLIPTGKTYEAIIQCYGGNATIPARKRRCTSCWNTCSSARPGRSTASVTNCRRRSPSGSRISRTSSSNGGSSGQRREEKCSHVSRAADGGALGVQHGVWGTSSLANPTCGATHRDSTAWQQSAWCRQAVHRSAYPGGARFTAARGSRTRESWRARHVTDTGFTSRSDASVHGQATRRSSKCGAVWR